MNKVRRAVRTTKGNVAVSLVLVAMVMMASCQTQETPTGNGWKKDPSNPVVKKGDPPSYDFINVADCWVLFDEGKYKMWYTAGGAVAPNPDFHNSIAYATSDDGINWVKYDNNPVLDISPDAWDSLGIETVTVIVDDSAPAAFRYKLWYAGQTFNDYRYEIGYAYSPDGINWTKQPGAVLTVGSATEWDNCFLEGPTVIKEDGQYKMWYAGFDCEVNGQSTDGKVNIGYATSADGITWTKHANNPVFTTTTSAWDAVTVQDPTVIKHNGLYHMWYGGVDVDENYFQQTGYASSEDGILWTKSDNNPVVKRGKSGAWDANTASFPSVLINGGKLKMWYTGKDVHPLPAWPTPYFWDVGYAEKLLPATEKLD